VLPTLCATRELIRRAIDHCLSGRTAEIKAGKQGERMADLYIDRRKLKNEEDCRLWMTRVSPAG